ncbi:hypothetical protein Nepgr_014326 [Nepenthes gracilis]|uniref:Uncharacterized protein n=1 Tax=Nepenthes gracilis TaxID=150966 RepID=A0AAD3SIY7_NEPGR|nr:hypothetical protein Nepgr_014326 [Nepenthes gracilis]
MGFVWVGVCCYSCFDSDQFLSCVCGMFLRGKKKLMSLFWRARAELRRQFSNGGSSSNGSSNNDNNSNSIKKKKKKKKRSTFHVNYDAFSYSLNFDNGNFGFLC